MKAVLTSIQPKWVEKIANGEKTIEVRKTAPKQVPFKGYIYCTFPKKPAYTLWLNRGTGNKFLADGKVIGEFICDKVIKTCGWRLRGDTQQCAKRTTDEEALPELACLTIDEIAKYAGSETREVCGWHIFDLKIYDKPKELSEFWKVGKCPYATENGCTYNYHCFRAGQMNRCGETLTRPPQSWQYVEE